MKNFLLKKSFDNLSNQPTGRYERLGAGDRSSGISFVWANGGRSKKY